MKFVFSLKWFLFSVFFFKQSKCAQCCLETGWLNELPCNEVADKLFPLPTIKIICQLTGTLDRLSVLAVLLLLSLLQFAFVTMGRLLG